MDITFRTEEGTFNYRVCAVIINDNKILAMKDSDITHYYLPGGRVRLHETADDAVLRELYEELGIKAEIIRPLWLAQSFFELDNIGEKYHELCIYYLVDISKTNLLSKGGSFILKEGKATHIFDWLEFDRLKDKYFYPLFLKTEIFDIPENLKIITAFE